MLKTSQEWFSCSNPMHLLPVVMADSSQRKRLLFRVTCCKRIWHLLDESSRILVGLVEQYAHSEIDFNEPTIASEQIGDLVNDYPELCAESLSQGVDEKTWMLAANAALHAAYGPRSEMCWDVCDFASRSVGYFAGTRIQKSFDEQQCMAELAAQATLVRDIFPNPFQPLPEVPSICLEWNDGVVIKLAESIYCDQAFEKMPVLADALMDAGCSDQQSIQHCQQSEPHVRGCWVIDLLLKKT